MTERVPVMALAWFGCLHVTLWRKRLPAPDPDVLTLDAFRLCWWDRGSDGVALGVLPVDRL